MWSNVPMIVKYLNLHFNVRPDGGQQGLKMNINVELWNNLACLKPSYRVNINHRILKKFDEDLFSHVKSNKTLPLNDDIPGFPKPADYPLFCVLNIYGSINFQIYSAINHYPIHYHYYYSSQS